MQKGVKRARGELFLPKQVYSNGMKSLYHEIIMDHYRTPRCWGTLSSHSIHTGLDNPSCGDSVEWYALVADNRLEKVAFQGKGCVISLATASLLAEWSTGKLCAEVVAADAQLVQKLLGTILGISRLKCATLPLEALQRGISLYNKTMRHKEEQVSVGSSQVSTSVSAAE